MKTSSLKFKIISFLGTFAMLIVPALAPVVYPYPFGRYFGPDPAHAAAANGIIVMWDGTSATANQAGWSRYANLDGYYIRGAAAGANADDTAHGNATHTHNSVHSHTVAAHTHSAGSISTATTTNAGVGNATSGNAARLAHTHNYVSGNERIDAGGNLMGFDLPANAAYDTANNDPWHVDMIFLLSNGTTDIPANALAFWNSNNLPAGWTLQYAERFPVGAAANANGGVTTNGTANSHTHTDAGHTHSEPAHTHAGNTGVSTSNTNNGAGANTQVAPAAHRHNITTNSANATSEGSTVAPASAAANGEPPWAKLNIIKNTNTAQTPEGIIAIWTGNVSAIPTGWQLCNGTGCTTDMTGANTTYGGNFVKGGNLDLPATGGTANHTHTGGGNHSHSVPVHNHTIATVANTSNTSVPIRGVAGYNGTTTAHNHAITGNTANSAAYNTGATNAALNASADDANSPPYKHVLFIQYNPSYTLTQTNWRWYASNGSVTLTDPWATGATIDLAEKAAIIQIPAANMPPKFGDHIRIQINFAATTGSLAATQVGFTLQYSAAEDCTTAGSWTPVGAKASGSIWRLFDEAALADSVTQVNQLTNSTAGAEGYYSEINSSAVNPNAVANGQLSEWDWPVENNGAASDTTYCFRMIKSTGGVISYNSDSYPKLTTAPGPGDVMRHGDFFQNGVKKGFFWAE
jgi:hypothetical protein